MNFLKKIDILYIVTLVFLLLASFSNFLGDGNVYWIIGMAFMVVVAFARSSFKKKEITYIGILTAVFLTFVTIRDLFINNLQSVFLLSDIGYLAKYIYLSFLYAVLLKDQAPKYLVLVTVHLTVISFFFYALQLIGLGQQVHDIPIMLNLPPSVFKDDGYSNFLVFGITINRHDYANSGFLWEPGSYGCILLMTLLLNFYNNKFKFDKKAVILLIGVLTTLSTTSYISLLVLLILFYRVRVPKLNPWLLLIIPMVVAIFLLIPFLWQKISASYDSDAVDITRLNTLEKFYTRQHQQIPLGRFSSMYLISDFFGQKLILGYSNKYSDVLNRKNDVNISNGIFDFMARFGLVGLIYLAGCFLRFFYDYLRKPELLVYCALLLLIMNFGEPILVLPITLIFIFWPFMQEKKKKSEPVVGARTPLAMAK